MVRDPLEQPFSLIYRRKGEEVAAQLAQIDAPPKLISSPLIFRILRKSYESITEAY